MTMKLNPDCIRDILLMVEKHSDYLHATEFKYNHDDFKALNIYTVEEIAYHVQQCEMSELIYNVSFYDYGEGIDIRDLTPKGHAFLANISQDNNWNKTKEIASKAGSFGLDILRTISEGVATAYVKQQLNLL